MSTFLTVVFLLIFATAMFSGALKGFWSIATNDVPKPEKGKPSDGIVTFATRAALGRNIVNGDSKHFFVDLFKLFWKLVKCILWLIWLVFWTLPCRIFSLIWRNEEGKDAKEGKDSSKEGKKGEEGKKGKAKRLNWRCYLATIVVDIIAILIFGTYIMVKFPEAPKTPAGTGFQQETHFQKKS